MIEDIVAEASSKIVFLVIDGLGGLPHPGRGKTELEEARTPNLDELARKGLSGLLDPVAPGITPGSGPGHLALFGYDPLKYELGRGVLEVMGKGFELREDDIAIRANFCTMRDGKIVDRRAGRIDDEEAEKLCSLLSEIKIPDVEIFVLHVKEHRFGIVLRGEGLSPLVQDTDPQKEGLPPKEPLPRSREAEKTSRVAKLFVERAREILSGHPRANMIIMRGFSKLPRIEKFPEKYRLRAASIASYPMYRGLSRILGMDVLNIEGDIISTLRKNYDKYDFFYLHIKETDKAGEDGNFDLKVRILEEIDGLIPSILSLKPDVLFVGSDHSTPSVLKGHSWHPVPFIIYSGNVMPSGASGFSERGVSSYRIRGVDVMPLVLAHAGRLMKYGA